MASRLRTILRRRLGVLIAGAVVVTSLTAASAGAATSAPRGMQAAGPTRLATTTSTAAQAPSPAPGFLLERGRFKPVAPPRGLEDLAPQGISPLDINDQGQIVGSYTDPAVAEHGFRLDRGRFATVDVPGAKGTQVQGINHRGQIVGVYSDTSNPSITGAQLRGFLLDRGRHVQLDVPGAVTSQAFDINNRGQIVGVAGAPDPAPSPPPAGTPSMGRVA